MQADSLTGQMIKKVIKKIAVNTFKMALDLVGLACGTRQYSQTALRDRVNIVSQSISYVFFLSICHP